MKKIKSDSKPKGPSNLYSRYRDLGLVCQDNVFDINFLGNKPFLSISQKSYFHIYDVESLNLLFISEPIPNPNLEIKHLLGDQKENTFCSYSNGISKYYRAKLKCSIEISFDIIDIILLGEYLLLLGESDLVITSAESMEEIKSISLSSSSPPPLSSFPPLKDDGIITKRKATCMIHPDTYLNKILIGFNDGSLELWNIKTEKMIYAFTKHFNDSERITCLVQSPAVDVIAVGLSKIDNQEGMNSESKTREGMEKPIESTNRVIILNAREDSLVQVINLQSNQIPTVLSFRTDSPHRTQDDSGQHLAITTKNGSLIIWNLERERIDFTIERKYSFKVMFLHSNPIFLLASGSFNSIEEWIFENGDYRKLKSRYGPKSFPHLLRWFGSDGRWLLQSDSSNSLHMHSIIKDSQSITIQGKNPIQSFDFYDRKDLTWSNVASFFGNQVTLWRADMKSLEKNIIFPHEITLISSSSCGHFGIVVMREKRADSKSDSFNFHLQVFNMQSGLLRRRIEIVDSKKSVIGVHFDQESINIYVVLEDCIRSYDFYHGKFLWEKKIDILDYCDSRNNFNETETDKENRNENENENENTNNSSQNDLDKKFNNRIVKSTFYPDSYLLALVLERDHEILIFDCLQQRENIRILKGHEALITDLSFTQWNGGRWLISSSMDCTFKTWDLITGHMIDSLKLDTPIISISISSNGQWMALSQKGKRGIQIWTVNSLNISKFLPLFDYSHNEKSVDSSSSLLLESPTSITTTKFDSPPLKNDSIQENSNNILINDNINENEIENEENCYISLLVKDMIRLSVDPLDKWISLPNYSKLRASYKPIKAIKVEPAPFFLDFYSSSDSTSSSIMTKDPLMKRIIKEGENKEKNNNQLENKSESESESENISNNEIITKDNPWNINRIKQLGLSLIDYELQSNMTLESMKSFLEFIKSSLDCKSDYEITISCMTTFLKYHQDELLSKRQESSSLSSPSLESILFSLLKEILDKIKQDWEPISKGMGESIGIIEFIRK